MTKPSPSPDTIRAFLKRHGITGSRAARMMYLSGDRQVRKYTGGERDMDLCRWFALHAHVMLSDDEIARIEAAMLSDSKP